MFVLVMQFLWLYIDDLIGKGIDGIIIAEFLMYQSTTFIPLAIPLAILLSSIMTFGNLGQFSELIALKAAGISLFRMMLPITLFSILVAGLAFFTSNYLIPEAQLKSKTLLYDISQQKPAFNIREKVFYNGIDGYSIRIGKKDKDLQTIHDILIYDHTAEHGKSAIVQAKHGKMLMNSDKSRLTLTLYEGIRFEELENRGGTSFHPSDVTQFGKQTLHFDMSGFQLSRTREELFKDNYQMLNIFELSSELDSLALAHQQKRQNVIYSVAGYFHLYDSFPQIIKNPNLLPDKNVIKNFSPSQRQEILNTALTSARAVKSILDFSEGAVQESKEFRNRYAIEWHRKFTLSFACILFFFIGAPFGSIIRRGGLGLPMMAAVVFFVIYYILSISGEKSAKEDVLEPWWGTWLSTLILLPVALTLTWQAANDTGIFTMDFWQRIFTRKPKSTRNV